jgi:hypothetical protein
MAVEWRKVAIAAILADGKVDETEAKLLQKHLWEGGKLTPEGLEFLLELRAQASSRAKARKEELTPAFNKLFYKAVSEKVVSSEGNVAAAQVAWLREKVFTGKKVDPKKLDAGQKEFLTGLNKKVKTKGPELEKLLTEAEVGAKPAAAKAKK